MKLTHDIRLWQVNRLIKKYHKSRHFHYISISKMHQVHPVTRTKSLRKVEERVEALQEAALREGEIINKIKCRELMPSITPMQVAKFDHNNYYIFEGNSRYVALKRVMQERGIKDLTVEVEVFDMTGNQRVLNKIKVLRKKNGLAGPVMY